MSGEQLFYILLMNQQFTRPCSDDDDVNIDMCVVSCCQFVGWVERERQSIPRGDVDEDASLFRVGVRSKVDEYLFRLPL